MVRCLLDAGVAKDVLADGKTPLMLASERGHLETARLLVESRQALQPEQRPSLQSLPDWLFKAFQQVSAKILQGSSSGTKHCDSPQREAKAQVLKLLSVKNLLKVLWPSLVGRNKGHGDPHLPGHETWQRRAGQLMLPYAAFPGLVQGGELDLRLLAGFCKALQGLFVLGRLRTA